MTYFEPHEYLNKDESMTKNFERHSCRQFIKGKAIGFSSKGWCFSFENSYLVNFQKYQGKEPNLIIQFGSRIAPLVMMCEEFPGDIKSLLFQISIDNLFTSWNLLIKRFKEKKRRKRTWCNRYLSN